MKKLLVPVDFSNHSKYALEVAAKIAKDQKAEIVIVHMMGLSEAIVTKDESQEIFEAMYYMKLAEKRFEEFLDQDFLKGLKVHTTVQNYKNFNELNSVAEEFDVDLIVMGSHGSSGLREVFVGSNTEKVVRNANVPVLVVKHRMKDFKLDNIVFASDFKPENIKPFQKALKMAETFNSNLELLLVNLPGERFRSTNEMQDRVAEFLAKAGDNNYHYINDTIYYSDYSVEDGIFSYCNKEDVDVIIIPTHGRRGLSHFFAGSITEDIANHSDIPVMTFKI